MSDIFDETEENLRADQWVAIVKKGWPWASAVLGAALVVTLGVWGYQSWQTHVASHASEIYEAALDSLHVKNDKVAAKAQFEQAENAGNPAYKAMALMQLGALAQDDNKPDEAIKDFDAAAKASSSPIISDMAALKAALASMDTASFSDIEKRLTPLIKDGRPVSPLAKEALAMAKLQNGDVKGARNDLQVLSLTLGTPDGVKQRAEADVLAIDSGAAVTARALMTQPEAKAPVIQPSMLPPGMQEAGQGAAQPAS